MVIVGCPDTIALKYGSIFKGIFFFFLPQVLTKPRSGGGQQINLGIPQVSGMGKGSMVIRLQLSNACVGTEFCGNSYDLLQLSTFKIARYQKVSST